MKAERITELGGLLAALAVASCGPPAQSLAPVHFLDQGVFVAGVQPIFAARCANPTCHGRPDRPLSLYAPLQWRLDPSHTFYDEPLSSAELEHNFEVACVFATEATSPDRALLLLKPLGSAAGEFHGGGDVFLGTADADYRTLRGWIEPGWTP